MDVTRQRNLKHQRKQKYHAKPTNMVRQYHKIHPQQLCSHIATSNNLNTPPDFDKKNLNTLACKASAHPVTLELATSKDIISFWDDAKAVEYEKVPTNYKGVQQCKLWRHYFVFNFFLINHVFLLQLPSIFICTRSVCIFAHLLHIFLVLC